MGGGGEFCVPFFITFKYLFTCFVILIRQLVSNVSCVVLHSHYPRGSDFFYSSNSFKLRNVNRRDNRETIEVNRRGNQSMTSRDVTAGRLETARHCLETLCNDCYRKVFSHVYQSCANTHFYHFSMLLAVNSQMEKNVQFMPSIRYSWQCERIQGGEGGLDNDDIMLINLSDIVFEALNCVAGNTVSTVKNSNSEPIAFFYWKFRKSPRWPDNIVHFSPSLSIGCMKSATLRCKRYAVRLFSSTIYLFLPFADANGQVRVRLLHSIAAAVQRARGGVAAGGICCCRLDYASRCIDFIVYLHRPSILSMRFLMIISPTWEPAIRKRRGR